MPLISTVAPPVSPFAMRLVSASVAMKSFVKPAAVASSWTPYEKATTLRLAMVKSNCVGGMGPGTATHCAVPDPARCEGRLAAYQPIT